MKVQIPKGFQTNPEHVVDLINCGARIILLRTEDCRPDPDEVDSEYRGRGFDKIVAAHPDIDWWIEVGNEPDICGMDPAAYRRGLLATVGQLRATYGPRVRWMASLPVNPGPVDIVLAGGTVNDAYDAIAYHLYGHYSLTDGEMYQTWQRVQSSTSKPLYLTEMGINHPPMPKAEKAKQYLAFWRNPPARLAGMALWTISSNPAWANMALDEAACNVLADRYPERRWFAETQNYVDGAFYDYWRWHGGLPIFGYPITPARMEAGMIVQWFERARFEWHPDNPDAFKVLLGRLGAEALERR